MSKPSVCMQQHQQAVEQQRLVRELARRVGRAPAARCRRPAPGVYRKQQRGAAP